MNAWLCDFGGGLDSLRPVRMATPTPGKGQVLVRVEAVSMNRRELSILAGKYPLPVKDTLIPAADGVGEVVELGEGVAELADSSASGVAVGDRVIGAVFPQWIDGPFALDRSAQLGGSRDGMLAEYVCLDAASVVPIPADIPVEQAACLPCAGVTAWHALHIDGAPGPGDVVLSRTSGGVSTFVIALATAMGCRVLVATSDAGRTPALTELGAERVITSGPNLVPELLSCTDSGGVDRTIHNYGNINDSLAGTKIGGSVSLVSTAGADAVNPDLIFGRNVGVHPISLGTVQHTRELVDFAAAHHIRIPIAGTFAFDETHAAFSLYAHHPPFGKIVIRVR